MKYRCHAVFCYSLAVFSLTLFSFPQPAASAEPHKLAVITYMQETCTFCPGGDTQIEDRAWRVPFVKGDDLIDRERGFIGGFVHAAREYPDVQVIGINSPDGVYGAPREAGKVEKASSISCRSSLMISKPICLLTVCILRFMARWR